MDTLPLIPRAAPALLLVLVWAIPTHRPPPPYEDERPLCAEADGPELIARPCTPGTDLRLATSRVRRALGRPPCWWTADARRLAELHGIGPATARTLATFRDAGGRPTVAELDALPGIGETAAETIASSVDVRCEASDPARRGRNAQGAPTRPGFRRTQRVQ